MSLNVERIENQPINSNCYIVYKSIGTECVVIDPGSENTEEIERFIDDNRLIISFVILTHSHFDHIWGVESLRAKYSFKLVCSRLCSEYITHIKKNLSVFYNQKGFVLKPAEEAIDSQRLCLTWSGFEILFKETPGHSKCSICFKIGDNLFTGDTAIKNMKTVTKIIGGSQVSLLSSLNDLQKYIDKKTVIYGGHEESFRSADFIISKFMGK
jgi:glyoxylase-like metal-dependent hydrolase (beta-lactamase superfamily II)